MRIAACAKILFLLQLLAWLPIALTQNPGSQSISQWLPLNSMPTSPECVCYVHTADIEPQHQQQQLYCRNRHSLPGDARSAAASHMGSRRVAHDFMCSEGRLFVRGAGVNTIEGELARSLEVAPSLQWLDLSANRLGALQQPHFASMPNLRRLELQENVIAALSYPAFDRLRFLIYLDLSANRLEAITKLTFGTRRVHGPSGSTCGLRSLRYLYLNDNLISRIEPGSFECLDALTELRLHRNLIAVLPNYAFQWLAALTSLKLHGNRLESVEEFAFSHCCGRLTKLSLVDNYLTYLPDHLLTSMPNLTTLYLDRNHFDRIPSIRGPGRIIDFHLQRNHIVRILRQHFLAWSAPADSLNLFDNSVRWIEDGAFAGLPPGTVSLVLQKNELRSLGARTLDGLTHLRYLVLADNRIELIEDGAFGHLVRLETLSLAGNRLTSLRSSMFLGLNRTFALSLGGNAIDRLPSGAFSLLPSLKYLYLEKNALTLLPFGIFSSLHRLKKLDLSDNRIASLDSQIFAGLTDLAFLDLSGNRLNRLCSATLHGPADRLGFLSLAKNRLTRLDPDLLAGLNRLRVLDLSDNRLSRFDGDLSDPQLTGGPAQLGFLDLGGNSQLVLTACSLCGLETLRHLRLPNSNGSSRAGDLAGASPAPCSGLVERASCLTQQRADLEKLRSESCQPSANLDADDGFLTVSPQPAGTAESDNGLHRAILLVSLPALSLLLLTVLTLVIVCCYFSSLRRRRSRQTDSSGPGFAGVDAAQRRRRFFGGYQPDRNLLELNVEQQQQQQLQLLQQHRRSCCSSSAASAGSEMPKFSNKVYSNLL